MSLKTYVGILAASFLFMVMWIICAIITYNQTMLNVWLFTFPLVFVVLLLFEPKDRKQ